MNSIETYQPPKVSSLESEEKIIGEGEATDAAALEALRALMGGFASPASSFQPSLENTAEEPASLLAMLENLLGEGSLDPSLAGLVTSLRDRLAAGGDLASNPDAAAQMKTLLQGLTAGAENSQVLQQARETFARILTEPVAGAEVRPDVAPFPEAPPEVANLGQSILQSLDSQSAAAAAQTVAGAPTAERIEQVSSLMSQMADRVLVTDPLHGQVPEVRIKLADSIIPGTEVRVWREDGGQLRVEFDTVSPYWARVLNEASPLLSQRLNERLQMAEPAQVTVQHQGEQPEDGRSRNRYTPWEIAQQSNEE